MKKMTRFELDTRIAKLSRWDLVALLLAVLIGGMLATLSVARYRGYNAGMLDIGNMSQAIWSGTQGHSLEFTYKQGNLSRLALHGELFYFLLVPLYALFPSPVTLLIFQAALFAAGAFPLYALARRRLASISAALAITATYLFYPVAQTAVLFDFHGDTLAMPLLLFAIEALDRQAWKNYALWLTLALSCKLYVAAPVAALGGMLWLQGRRRVGMATFLAGVGWGSMMFGVVRLLFAPAHAEIATGSGYFNFYFGQLRMFLGPSLTTRLVMAFIVLLPALWVGYRNMFWALPALSIVLPALSITGRVGSYDYRFHHYALAVPFLLAAIVYGAEEMRLRQENMAAGKVRPRRPWRGEVYLTLVLTLIFNATFVDIPLNPKFWRSPPGWGWDSWAYGRTARDAMKDVWLGVHVPPTVPLGASMFLAPHLVNRETLYLLGSLGDHEDAVNFVVADALFDYAVPFGGESSAGGKVSGVPPLPEPAGAGGHPAPVGGGVLYDVPTIARLLTDSTFALVADRDGLLLFERNPSSGTPLLQKVEALHPVSPIPLQTRFGEAVGLVTAEIQPLGGRRFRLVYEWTSLQSLVPYAPLFAVTRLEGAGEARFVHLPTLALHPTSMWQPEEIVRETFEIVVPADIPAGTYPLRVGWYDSANWFAFATDARSRVGEEVQVGVLELP